MFCKGKSTGSENNTIFFDKLLDIMVNIAGILLIFITLLVSVDVFLRYVLNSPLEITIPFSEFTLVLIVSLGGAWLLREDGFVTIDLLLERLSLKMRYLLKCISSFISAFFILIVAIFSIPQTWELIVTKARIVHASSIIPHAAYTIPLNILYFLLFIQFIRNGLKFGSLYKEGKE
jgi:C4-dicarboxylate transporter DctQ subunit